MTVTLLLWPDKVYVMEVWGTIVDITTPPVSIERSDCLNQEGWLNACAAEQNSQKFVEYLIAVQACIDTDGVVKTKTPSAIG